MRRGEDLNHHGLYDSVRRHSLAIAAPLSAEDCGAQSMPDASPLKWHLAHTTWFFETFVLERFEPGFVPFHPRFRTLFNSYYNGIGARHPRPQRGLLTRPSLAEVLAYRDNVDQRMAALLSGTVPTGLSPAFDDVGGPGSGTVPTGLSPAFDDVGGPGSGTVPTGLSPAFSAIGGAAEGRGQSRKDSPLVTLVELGLQHEQQHQELMLTDLKHLFAQNALLPAYTDAPLAASPQPRALDWIAFEGGMRELGHAGDGFCFDNELPRHPQYVLPFTLANRLVTNGEYLAFVQAGGYRDPSLWLSEGWDAVCAQGLGHPLYWMRMDDGSWGEFTLHGLQALDLHRPVTHVSLHEADAFAQWSGARLPTEAEWECAAAGIVPGDGALHPRAASGAGLAQMFGECWQWTSSSYGPYPGFAPAPGALGEYNGKFMLNQYVLRGSSCVTPAGHARASYRNFFPAHARWQFSGIRLAGKGG